MEKSYYHCYFSSQHDFYRCLSWTPGGRRLLTGNQEGEFTLWDGVNFSFELIMSAHDQSFRCMAWSHNQNYLLTSDSGGNIKYWSPSIAPVQSLDSHGGQPIHALSFSPADTKFVSCGDDATVRIWDWAGHREERTLEGHGWDVKCAQWHPRSSVIVSGSKVRQRILPYIFHCLTLHLGQYECSDVMLNMLYVVFEQG